MQSSGRTLLQRAGLRPLIQADGKKVVNFCANNYLGLANHPKLIEEAKKALDLYGYGMASVRFICGTQSVHKKLEDALTKFLKMEETILYSSCFDANAGLFETILSGEDAIFSDELNHASIIDGVRLSKAARFRYRNNDMNDLEDKLRENQNFRHKLICTDGVFSMDGYIAKLKDLVALKEKYGCLLMVDDSHAVGFLGETGKGTHEQAGVLGKIDILTGTLGKALGGASGGYTSGKKEIISYLRQRSRPYLFSNTLAPVIAHTSLKAIELIQDDNSYKNKLMSQTKQFRSQLRSLGFDILDGQHPIVPIMVYDAVLAQRFSEQLLEEGLYVVSFSYPVVPKDKARIRIQISADHSQEDLDQALLALQKVAKRLNIIK